MVKLGEDTNWKKKKNKTHKHVFKITKKKEKQWLACIPSYGWTDGQRNLMRLFKLITNKKADREKFQGQGCS